MLKVIFVTGNAGKFREAKDILAKKGIEVLQQTGGYPEIQEDEL